MSHFQLIVFTVLYEKMQRNLDQTPQNMILNSSEQIRIHDIYPQRQNLFFFPIYVRIYCKAVNTNSLFYSDVTVKYTSCLYPIRAQFLSMWDANTNSIATRGLTISHFSCTGTKNLKRQRQSVRNSCVFHTQISLEFPVGRTRELLSRPETLSLPPSSTQQN